MDWDVIPYGYRALLFVLAPNWSGDGGGVSYLVTCCALKWLNHYTKYQPKTEEWYLVCGLNCILPTLFEL